MQKPTVVQRFARAIRSTNFDRDNTLKVLQDPGPRKLKPRKVKRMAEDNTPSEMSTTFSNPEMDSEETTTPPGMSLEIKQFYRTDPREAWDTLYPSSLTPPISSSPSLSNHALIVRREQLASSDTTLALHSITIQSPLIKSFLGPIFDGFQGISTKLQDLTFIAPFHEFFYRWDNFLFAMQKERDEETRNHVALLWEVMQKEIKPHLEKKEDLLRNGLVTFEYLWALFEPGMDICSEIDEQDRLFKLVNARYQRTQTGIVFVLSCRFVDTNGMMFGYVTTSLKIDEFEGILPVSGLEVLPAELHARIDGMRSMLRKRGQRFRELNGLHFKSYTGFYVTKGEFFGASRKRNVEKGRIIIDGNMYAQYNQEDMPKMEPLHAPPGTHSDFKLSFKDAESETDSVSPYQEPKSVSQRNSYSNLRSNLKPNELSDDDLIYCTPMLRGYCLTAKQWVSFYVDLVEDITWNEDAFQRLVLPHDYKEIVLAFVDSQLNGGDQFDDIVQGKGQGIIMLLSGEPGVGKTLTAESVAEEMKRPLYSMSAGELGLTADQVENSLHRVLEISTKWGAVLLLDECDVFLEQRTVSDLERNKLVSVFLRLLEYFKGVLFLTTNRVSTFDAAFQSRIHLVINYPSLDYGARMMIWHNFIRPDRLASSRYASVLTEKEIEQLAGMALNGREIKNTVKTAQLLATRKKTPLAMEHIQTVLRVKKGLAGNGAEVTGKRKLEL